MGKQKGAGPAGLPALSGENGDTGRGMRQLSKSPPDFTVKQVLHKMLVPSSQKQEGSDLAASIQKSDSHYPMKTRTDKPNQ